MDDVDPPAVICDWKASGNDFLGQFVEAYPELDFFKSDSFEELRDELGRQDAETCFGRVAAFLVGQGYGLWSMKTGGDDYCVVVVADGEEPRMPADLLAVMDIPADAAYERIVPDVLLQAEAEPRREKPRLPSIVEARDDDGQAGGIWRPELSRAMADLEQEDGSFGPRLIDPTTFPIANFDADGFYKLLDEGNRFTPLYSSSTGQYWSWLKSRQPKPPKARRHLSSAFMSIVLITDYVVPVVEEVEGSEMWESDLQSRCGIGDVLFLIMKLQPDSARCDPKAPEISGTSTKAGERAGLVVVQELTMRHIATLHAEDAIVPLTQTRVAVLSVKAEDNAQPTDGVAYCIFDCETGAVAPRGRLAFDAVLRPSECSGRSGRLNYRMFRSRRNLAPVARSRRVTRHGWWSSISLPGGCERRR